MPRTITLDELERRLTDAAEHSLRELVQDTATAAADRMERLARENLARALSERSGALARSIRTEVELEGEFARVSLLAGGEWQGLRIPYAAAHEWGVPHLRPKNRKYLTIPVENALNGAGLPKYPSVQAMPFAEFRRTSSGQLIVVDARNDELWYVLVTEVTIPERPYLRPAVAQVLEEVPALLAQAAAARVVGEA